MGGKISKRKQMQLEILKKLDDLDERTRTNAQSQEEKQLRSEIERMKTQLENMNERVDKNERDIDELQERFSVGIDRLVKAMDDRQSIKTGIFDAKPNTHNHVGLCIILTNNVNDSDVDRLADAFSQFQFAVEVFANMTSAQLMQTLSTAVRPELEYSCVAVAVIWKASNRNNARLGENVMQTIWTSFVRDGNAWNDKPKLFFLQIDELLRQDDLDLERQYPSPANRDILIVHNTPGARESFSAILTKRLKDNPRQEITKTMERLKEKGKIKYISTLHKQFYFSNCA